VKDLFITNNLTKAFGGLVAVNEVSLAIKENTFTLLIGPNGSGKTTFLNVCTGVLSPDGGEVKFEDKDITGWSPENIYELGFVRTFQIPMPFLSLTVLDNVLSAMKNPGESPLKAIAKRTWVKEEEKNVERALEILWRVGLYKDWDKPAYSLGGAQLKMLEISRSLASGAKLVALDEPIGGVDPIYADEILTYIARLKGYGLTFLVIEHRIDIVVPFADYAYAMDRGSLISQGKPQDVLNDPKVIEIYIG
jgi:branched-chain amino acid transport system ATP-binding protein